MDGWVKLLRKLRGWGWYKDVPVKTVFIELLLIANYDNSEWKGIQLERGQCVIGRKQIALDTGLTEQQVRTALKKLKSTGEITTKSTNKYTIVTVVNYSLYQSSEEAEQPTNEPTINQQSTNNQPTNNQQSTTYKEINKERNKEVNKYKGVDYGEIIALYNDTCVSFPRLKSLSEKRKKAIKARLNKYTIDDFRTLFEKAEASDFLKGSNVRNWTANFDWLITDGNMAKVLDGNYDNRNSTSTKGGFDFADYL